MRHISLVRLGYTYTHTHTPEELNLPSFSHRASSLSISVTDSCDRACRGEQSRKREGRRQGETRAGRREKEGGRKRTGKKARGAGEGEGEGEGEERGDGAGREEGEQGGRKRDESRTAAIFLCKEGLCHYIFQICSWKSI